MLSEEHGYRLWDRIGRVRGTMDPPQPPAAFRSRLIQNLSTLRVALERVARFVLAQKENESIECSQLRFILSGVTAPRRERFSRFPMSHAVRPSGPHWIDNDVIAARIEVRIPIP